MINLDMTFEDMKSEIEFDRILFDEVISPKENFEYFSGNVRVNLRYFFESLSGFDKKLCESCGENIIQLFGELQYNSFMHGNKFDLELPVHLKVLKGECGYVFQIEDCGEGFDFKETLRKYENGEKHYENGGCGFDEFKNSKKCVVSYEGKGNIANLMYKL